MKIDLCLSSASREGYSQDVVDTLAMPVGSRKQFRYAKKWISEGILNELDGDCALSDRQALICYIAQTTKGVTPTILPLRLANIVDIKQHGSTVSLTLELGSFAKIGSLKKFNDLIRKKIPGLPDYKEKELTGKYWIDCEIDENTVHKSVEIGDWENLVEKYFETPNASDAQPFYKFVGLYKGQGTETVTPTIVSGIAQYNLRPSADYELRFYHFDPEKDFPNKSLVLKCENGLVSFLDSPSRSFNTRYDLKRFRFRTSNLIQGSNGLITVIRSTTSDKGVVEEEDFSFSLSIGRSYWKIAVFSIFFAVAFTIPHTITAVRFPDVANQIIILAFVGGLIAAAVTIFKDGFKLK